MGKVVLEKHSTRKRNLKEISLKEDMKQNWLQNSYSKHYTDQFGFIIHNGEKYKLEFKGQPIATLHSLAAAQMISTIILNDIIENKKL